MLRFFCSDLAPDFRFCDLFFYARRGIGSLLAPIFLLYSEALPNRRIKRRCIITGKPLRYYRYRDSIMYVQDSLFAVNLDALYFTCSYIPERGCAKFLNLTHPLRE